MPPKITPPHKSIGSTNEVLDAINFYLAKKPDFDKYINEAKQDSQPHSQKSSEYDQQIIRAVADSIEAARQRLKLLSDSASASSGQ